ncbi:MAG: YHS domain protein [Chitinophagaceae bacterium]|nr:YHS domain protein [Chitinophagaceae bacterium]
MKLILLIVWTLSTLSNLNAQKSPVFIKGGKAIHGFDAVSYFSGSEPKKGSDSLSYSWQDATWFFATRANLKLFKANPIQYAPQYGGYCAFGTSRGYKASTEPDAWSIVEGKLYFNYNKKVRESWSKDKQGYIRKADEQWPLIINKG